ncbi:NepR family anti-sigma factor [Oceanomicrobium pacificus]|uniref:NepR family anti-sigma factor n=1 Tax=Oceanomicrobium pacificus TaxID=2692916 RepID=UPI002E2A9224|nr:NepR family anti-sigma factor [Oceanomicrobium pacificus]
MQDEKQERARIQIDENLKRVYQEAVEEALPDRFHDLLEKLKAQDAQKQGNAQK